MKVELIIPNNDNDGAPNEALIERSIADVCKAFGGATVYDARGCWVNDDGKLYDEPVTVIASAATDRKMASGFLASAAKALLDATDQEAVFTSIDGEATIFER